MIRPNEISAPGETAARARVEALFVTLDRRSWADLLAAPRIDRDLEARAAQVSTLERAAARAGRAELLADARAQVVTGLGARPSPVPWLSASAIAEGAAGTAADRAWIMLALQDAAAVAATEDLLEPDVAADLAEPGRRLLGLPPAVTEALDHAGRTSAWAPTAADWAAAATGDLAIDHRAPPPGTRALRAWFFGIVAITGAPAALAWGIAEASIWLGLLGATAIVAVCWTLATWRRPA